MNRQWKPLFIALLVSLFWYGIVRQIDFGLLDRNGPIGFLCLDNLPPGTIYTPEGSPRMPGASYSLVPLGIECSYTMTDGNTLRTFHVRYAQSVLAALPLLLSFVWAAQLAMRSVLRKRNRVNS